MRFLWVLLVVSGLAMAADVPVDDRIRITAPATDIAGDPIDPADLDFHTLRWQCDTGCSPGEAKVFGIPPGGQGEEPVTVVITGNRGDFVTVRYTATATNKLGEEGDPSDELTRTYEITIPPGQPTLEFVAVVTLQCQQPDGKACGLRQVAAR